MWLKLRQEHCLAVLPESWALVSSSLRVGWTVVGQTLLLCACFLDEIPVVQLDFEEIAAETHFRHEIVEQCVHETLLCFAGALRDNKEVEFSFRSIGILAVRTKVVIMTFFDSCLLELDTTGNMLKALLEVSLYFLWDSSSWLCGNVLSKLSSCLLWAAVTCLTTQPRHTPNELVQVSGVPQPL